MKHIRRFKPFKNSQRIRVIINGVTTITTINWICDRAIEAALLELSRHRQAGEACVGLCGDWYGKALQVDLINDYYGKS